MTRLLIFLLCGILLSAEDIFDRLRAAPLPPGEGPALAEALRKHDFADVEHVLESARAANIKDQAELLSLLGAVEFVAQDMNRSADSFQAAEKLKPLSDADSFTLAMAEIKLQQGPSAAARLQLLTGKYPQSPLYLYWLGRIDYDQRRYDEAVAKMQKVIELDPQSVRGYNSLGLAFDMQGKFEPARAALEKAVSLNQSQPHPSPWPPHDLGYLLLRIERFQEAETMLRESLRYQPAFAEAHYHLGRVLEKENTDEAAVAEYKKAVELDPASPEPCYSLAQLYRKMHQDANAEKMFAEYRKRKAAQ